MSTFAIILFTLSVLSALSWMILRVRRDRNAAAISADVARKKKSRIDCSAAVVGVFFGSFGLDAAIRGEAEIDTRVSGTDVRIAGALLFIVGLTLIVRVILNAQKSVLTTH